MVNVNTLAEKVFGILKGNNFQIRLYTIDGDETIDPEFARRFYVGEPAMMVTIDEDNDELELTLSKDIDITKIELLQKHLKRLANLFLLNYTIRNYSKSIMPRDFAYRAKIHRNKQMESTITESSMTKLSGSKRTSRQSIGETTLVIKHKRDVAEDIRGSRTRNISAIFLEHNGERHLFPQRHLGAARAMARHLHEGGSFDDTIGNFIAESAQRYIKLREFVKYATSSKLVNESTADILSVVKENMIAVRNDISRLTSATGYRVVCERVLASAADNIIEEDSVDEIRDMFTVKQFNEQHNEILPVISKIVSERKMYHSRIEEAASHGVNLRSDFASTSYMLEFESKQHEISHKLSEVASNLIENDELASFVKQVSEKLCTDGKLSAFESSVVSKVLRNATKYVEPQPQIKSELNESVQFENKLERYTQIKW